MTQSPTPNDLVVRIHQEDAWSVISVAGEIDAYTGPQLRSRLLEAIAEGRTQLILDFSEVSFLDSSALGVLIGAHKRVRDEGGQIRIVNARPVVIKLFQLTVLDKVFPLFPSLAAALEA